jgi:putative sterol carrier protein
MDDYVKLRRLTRPSEREVAATFERFGELMAEARMAGRVVFCLHDEDGRAEPSYWTVQATEQGVATLAQRAEEADLQVTTKADTWWRIADGRLSPLEAFVRGKLYVEGNIGLAKRLVKNLAGAGELPAWLW